MGVFSKYNSGNGVNFNIDTKDFQFVKLCDLERTTGRGKNVQPFVHKIDGMFIVKGKMGLQPIFIQAETKRLINMPSYLTGKVQDILADKEAVEAIKAGNVGFTIYEYESHGKTCYGVTFVDL